MSKIDTLSLEELGRERFVFNSRDSDRLALLEERLRAFGTVQPSSFQTDGRYIYIHAAILSRPNDRSLGAIVRGVLAPRNGPEDITVYRESRGGPGDIALASYAY
ncbi:MAG: hypothetical protein GEU73_03505 [Chloroflexi bacterium]|nr:hypothetical protein [Chloroflexota bacterium]